MHKIIIFFLTTVLLISCGGDQMEKIKINTINENDLRKLSEKNVYFGHQSVGYNVIDGIFDIIKDYPNVKLNIVETDNPNDYKNGIFGHSGIGKNTDPISKIDDFVSKMNSGLGDVVDIAFFKLCYVDINSETNVENVFNYYKTEMNKLERKYKNVTFFHVTSPLMTNDRVYWGKKQKMKYYIKRILGMDIGKDENRADNIKRNVFNKLLKHHYRKVIDLAGYESTFPDATLKKDQYEQLIMKYTTDGGHLNVIGSKKVAYDFIYTIIGALK